MTRRRTKSVTAMALAATLLTVPAFADPAPASSVAADPSTVVGLPLRPSKPLALDPAPSSANAGWKLAAFALLAAGGFWVWKQRAKKAPKAEPAELRVLRRTTVGVRSELMLLEVEGQKLLLGVTPSSMQTLYLFPDSGSEEPVAEAPPAFVPPSERRMSALLESRIAAREPTRAKAPPPSAVEDDDLVEGQAAGLRAAGARR